MAREFMKTRILSLVASVICGQSALSDSSRPDYRALLGNVHGIDPVYYKRGVDHIVDCMENGKAVQLYVSGLTGPVDEELGLRVHPLGCDITDEKSSEADERGGEYAALMWYAQRGRYAINSFKKKLPDAPPSDLRFFNMDEEKTGATTGVRKVWVLSNHGSSIFRASLTGGQKIQLEAPTDCEIAGGRWAYDARSEILWLNVACKHLPHRYIPIRRSWRY